MNIFSLKSENLHFSLCSGSKHDERSESKAAWGTEHLEITFPPIKIYFPRMGNGYPDYEPKNQMDRGTI